MLKPDAVDILRSAIVDVIVINSRADQPTIEPLLNLMMLSSHCGTPLNQVNLRTIPCMEFVFKSQIDCARIIVTITLNIGSIFLNPDVNLVDPLDFSGFSVSKSACTAVTNATAAAAASQANVTTQLTTDATLALQTTAATLASQTAAAAAAATIAATLPSVFDSRQLPADVMARYDAFMDPSTIVTKSSMIPFAMHSGSSGPVLTYLNPPRGAGVPRKPTDANRIITSNGQFFTLADQGTDGLKNFQNYVPVCHGLTPEDIRSWYTSFTEHTSACGYYVHPYFCYRPSIPDLNGFTFGYDIPAVVGVPYSALIPATVTSPEIPEVPAVTAVPLTQFDIPGHLGKRLKAWSIVIYNAISQKGIFLKDSPQRRIIDQHYMRGYECLCKLAADSHPNNNSHPAVLIRTTPVQSLTETLSQYFHRYLHFYNIQGYLQNNIKNLNDKNELDLFIAGCIHSARLFAISREDRLNTDPIMQQRFNQGAIVNTLAYYLCDLHLPDGPSKPVPSSSRYHQDSDSDSDDDRDQRKIKKSRRTDTLRQYTSS